MKTGARGLSRLSEGFEKLFGHIKNLLKRGCMDGRYFTWDTLVPTKHGYTAIKEIQKDDGILSRDEKTGRTGFKEAEDVFIRTVHTIYHVWLDGKEEIKTTVYHPVYVQEQGWVAAINLREGDTLETMEGTACITKIVKERHEEPVTVYNLAVKDWVSYFVGKVRVYVHNGPYKGGTSVGNITEKLDTNNIPNMTKQNIINNIPDDWNYTDHNGFVHIRDVDGKMRIRIDPSDKTTNYHHVHVYDSNGNLLDSFGNIVDRKSPNGHIPYKDN